MDILVVIYLALSLWLVYESDVLGYTKIFSLVPAKIAQTKVFALLFRIRLFIFAIVCCAFTIGLYYLKKWAFIGTLVLNLITLITAEPLVRVVTFFAIIYLVLQREYFSIGEFKRPEYKDLIHVDLLKGDKQLGQPEERYDLKIEELLASGQLNEASEYAQGLIAIARQMADVKNLIFYEKYVEKINRVKSRTVL
ncbi:MAG: hypothetical protein PHF95_04200 [bacterium]|nr:hypothetical protein [bacterium]MDD5756006.1 hypothetical protein [bacterium]